MLKFSTDISYSIMRRGKTSGSKSTYVGWPVTVGCTLLLLVLSRLVSDCTVRKQYSALILHYTAVQYSEARCTLYTRAPLALLRSAHNLPHTAQHCTAMCAALGAAAMLTQTGLSFPAAHCLLF